MLSQNERRKYSFQEILKVFFLRDSAELGMVILYGAFAGLCSLVVPVAVQTFVNTLGFGLLLQPILILSAIVFFVLTFSGIASVLEVSVMELLQQRWFSRVSLEFAHRFTRIQVDAMRRTQPSTLAAYFLDIATVQKTLSFLILDAAAVSLQVLFGMVLLALYHPYFLIFDLLILAFIAVVFYGLKDPAIESSIKESKAKYEASSWLAELGRDPLSFRSGESRKLALGQMDDLSGHYVIARKKHFKILLRQIGGSALLQVLMSSLLLGAGGWLVIQRQLTLGQLVAAELVFGAVVAGISKYGKFLESYYDLHAAIEKIACVLNLPEENDGTEAFGPNSGEHAIVQVKAVGFINEFGHEVFKDLNFELIHDSITAICGKSGSGKSTLAEFLYGVRTPSSGVILAHGLDLKYRSLETLRSQWVWLGEAELFGGTLLANIRMGRDGIGFEQIQSVIRGLGQADWIESLPDGLMTRVSAGRFPLSSGQAKMILLARALVGRPQLLILDDFMDQLDSESLRTVVKFFKTGGYVSSVVFTSRNSDLCSSFDQIIFLPEGGVLGGEKSKKQTPSVTLKRG